MVLKQIRENSHALEVVVLSKLDQLPSDLRRIAAGARFDYARWSPDNDWIGAALIQLAAGKLPAELHNSGLETVDAPIQAAARRLIAESFFAGNADSYLMLGARRETSPVQLRKNYQRLIALVHPDAAPIGFPTDAATRVNKAYALICDADAIAHRNVAHTLPPRTRRRTEKSDTAATAAPSSASSWLSRLRAGTPKPRFRSGLIALCVTLGATVMFGGYALFTIETPPALVEARMRQSSSAIVAALPSLIAPVIPRETPATRAAEVRLETSPALSATAENVNTLSGSSPEISGRLAKKILTPINTINDSNALNNKAKTEIFSNVPTAFADAAPEPSRSSGMASETAPSRNPTALAATQPQSTNERSSGPTVVAIELPSSQYSQREVDELLALFSSAFESGSVAHLGRAFSPSMSGKSALLAEYERVFQHTKQRSIRFARMRNTPIGADRLLSSGHATVATVGLDDRPSRQRVYLEIEIARETEGSRIARIANYEQ